MLTTFRTQLPGPFFSPAFLSWGRVPLNGMAGALAFLPRSCIAGVLTEFLQQTPRDVPATAEGRGVFGPLKFDPVARETEEDDEEEDEEESEPEPEHEEVEKTRKRPVDRQHHAGLPNGSPAKRQRLSNGYENGADAATTPMEIDHADTNNANNHAYPSPLEGEQAASPRPRTEGPSRGTQVDKVHELAQETIFLRLGGDDEGSEAQPPRANENPLVLLAEWNPQDPSLLASAGTDALARVWTISRGTTQDGHVKDVSQPFRNLLDDDVPKTAIISAMAWNASGNTIALAIEMGSKTRISILGLDGTHIHRCDGIEPPVIKLRWSPNNDYILGVSPEKGGTLVTVLCSSMAESKSHFLEHDLHADALDAAWISETEFVVCGGDTLLSLRCTEEGIAPGRQFQTKRDEGFFQVSYDARTDLIATSSVNGTLDLWDESGQRRSISAHIGMITSLQWQPLQTEPAEDERLLASSGEDGAICIWNVRSQDKIPKHSMTMSLPVAAISMTPDGAFIAGATSDRILIWKVGDSAIPRASWTRAPHPGWQSPKGNSDTEDDFLPCLGWDSEGQRLVYGANSRVSNTPEHARVVANNSQLAVINFR